MGLTIYCKKTGRSIDMGAGGFLRLRNQIADLAGVGEHYRQIEKIMFGYFTSSKEKEKAFDEHDRKTELMVKTGVLNAKVARFLWESDVEARLPYGVAKAVLKVIGDYDNQTIYGYAGRPDAAQFRDFKAILQDCVDTKSQLIWD